jgi:hypothetical protein
MELRDQAFTVNMNFRKMHEGRSAGDFARGYLDDHLMLTFGLWDVSGHFAEVVVADVLKDHIMCEDLPPYTV